MALQQEFAQAEAPLPGDGVVLDLWLEHSSASDRDPIGLKGEPSYRYFWNTWIRYLRTGRNGVQDQSIAWHEAINEDVAGFLQSGPTARKAGSAVSDVTRRRYWRLLERIYEYAKQQGWVAINPATVMEEDDIPPQENSQGAIVLPRVWHALGKQLERPIGKGATAQALRDRALLLCFVELGLTPMEARSLTLSDVLYEAERGGQRASALQIDGPGPRQRRRMVLPDNVSQAVETWLGVRWQIARTPENVILFCTTRGGKQGAKGQMTPVMLMLLVRDAITKAATEANQPLPPRLGPQILRNTRLTMWLNAGVPAAEVAVWAGLKNEKGLHHLREHLNPEVRATVAGCRSNSPTDLDCDSSVCC
ncbi:integrase family protein [Acidovorax delafieldii 2AN]|jgi:integrase|uniref:Integrase family protein n=1 Tax=Acidovorax delafieldii 2AN TaxID=573060 RepID=C5T0E8_ACIDE|nr:MULTISPECIES: site-specific integrase [Burkholderiales]EER62101.1 integrase family protein [Acidovorax delafieldii 2AN]